MKCLQPRRELFNSCNLLENFSVQCTFHLIYGFSRSPPPFLFSVDQFECICVCIGIRSIVLYFTICKSVVRQLRILLLALLRCGFRKLSRHGHGVVWCGGGGRRRRRDSFVFLFHFKIFSTIQASSSSSSITVNREFTQLVRRFSPGNETV